ncbi:MAG: plasmid partitioning protein RepB [Pseudomonadota bacterium]
MARKNLLKGLMEPLETKSAGAPPAPATGARMTKGAIGAVSQSIADLKSRAIVDLDPHLIEAGGVEDRLEHDDAEDAQLRASIQDYGQQVPVLVRPHPEHEGRYQIVYGRRRVLALRDLGLSVKAMIRDLDDQALVMAQGQENTARRDLSFIEKVNFARQMRDAGYKRKVICDALAIDKTLISRMLYIADRVPLEAIHAIGSAPSVGRDRWIRLADLFEADQMTGAEASVLAAGESSDDRFDSVMNALDIAARRAQAGRAPKRGEMVKPKRLTGADGSDLGRARAGDGKTTLTLNDGESAGFADWLVENIEEIHRRWMTQRGE